MRLTSRVITIIPTRQVSEYKLTLIKAESSNEHVKQPVHLGHSGQFAGQVKNEMKTLFVDADKLFLQNTTPLDISLSELDDDRFSFGASRV